MCTSFMKVLLVSFILLRGLGPTPMTQGRRSGDNPPQHFTVFLFDTFLFHFLVYRRISLQIPAHCEQVAGFVEGDPALTVG